MSKLIIFAYLALVLASYAMADGKPDHEQTVPKHGNGYPKTRIHSNLFEVRYRTVGANRPLAEDRALRSAGKRTPDRKCEWLLVASRKRGFSDEALDRDDPMRVCGRDGRNRAGRHHYNERSELNAGAQAEFLLGNNPASRSSSIFDARQVFDCRPLSWRSSLKGT